MRINFPRILEQCAMYLVLALAILYLGDWMVFQVRQTKGTGMSSVPVEQYLATPLKGNKAEYDYLGTAETNCSRTLFPQRAASNWNPPCWWLRRHRTRWE
jgi:hypothetical protein